MLLCFCQEAVKDGLDFNIAESFLLRLIDVYRYGPAQRCLAKTTIDMPWGSWLGVASSDLRWSYGR